MGGIQCPVEQTKLQDPARNTIRPCFELIRFLRTIGYQTRASTALIFLRNQTIRNLISSRAPEEFKRASCRGWVGTDTAQSCALPSSEKVKKPCHPYENFHYPERCL